MTRTYWGVKDKLAFEQFITFAEETGGYPRPITPGELPRDFHTEQKAKGYCDMFHYLVPCLIRVTIEEIGKC